MAMLIGARLTVALPSTTSKSMMPMSGYQYWNWLMASMKERKDGHCRHHTGTAGQTALRPPWMRGSQALKYLNLVNWLLVRLRRRGVQLHGAFESGVEGRAAHQIVDGVDQGVA